jgi:hypothetical protein
MPRRSGLTVQNRAGYPLDVPAMRRVPFWLSVGAQDIQPVPSSYDNVLGQTRVERGAALQQAPGVAESVARAT